MKYLLTTLNSKFSHSSLAIRYLKKFCESQSFEPEIREYTINQHVDDIVRDIMSDDFDVITFSCYIWNYEMTLKIAEDIKLINPKVKLLLGGPEVSYNPLALLKELPYADGIMYGEGELTYEAVMSALETKADLSGIEGLVYRDGECYENSPRPLMESLDSVPFPYEDLSELDHRKIYYESSRGCPFNCQYCLSSTTGHVRFFSLERVKGDLQFFLDHKVEQVKFVDRTFNANPKRALEILKYIHSHDNNYTNFHFEIVASLLDDETMAFLKQVRVGLFQFEIGVQTTNPETMSAIQRNIDFLKLSDAVKQLSAYHNIHLHLDLIAGLPYENYESFLNSFEEVIALKPEKLQLGFLKLLKGSGLRRHSDMYGYIYSHQAPYEIFYNKYIGYKELVSLKHVEEMVEIYYNSKRFKNSIDMIIKKHYNRAVDFYVDLSKYWLSKELFKQPHKMTKLYQILLDFYIVHFKDEQSNFMEVLKYDYYANHQKQTDVFSFHPDKIFNNLCYEFLKAQTLFDNHGLSPKQWLKRCRFIAFEMDIINYISSNFEVIEYDRHILMFDYEVASTVFERSAVYDITETINKE